MKQAEERLGGGGQPGREGVCPLLPGRARRGESPSGWGRMCRPRPAPGSGLGSPQHFQAAAGAAGAAGFRERRRALSGPRRPRPSSGNRCPPRKGRKNCSARKGEELRGEARPRRGQRQAARVRPRPLGPRRARGALGTAVTHAPPATERRGARARRPRGRGAGGGGAVRWTLARARGAVTRR
nr:alpha-2A adrenergic receptor-like [Pan paniscus]